MVVERMVSAPTHVSELSPSRCTARLWWSDQGRGQLHKVCARAEGEGAKGRVASCGNEPHLASTLHGVDSHNTELASHGQHARTQVLRGCSEPSRERDPRE